MKRNICFVLVLAVAASVVLIAGCSRTTGDNHSTANQGSFNHNSTMANSNSATSHNGMNHASSANHNAVMNHSEMKSSPNAANAPYDLQFIDTMIAHHQGAIDMAKMAAENAQRAELKTFAAKIIADQNKEIKQMKQWREQWYAGSPAALNMEMPGMADSMKMDMAKFAAASGEEFDLMFIEMMIPHHAGATAMAKEALTRAEHREIKTLAQNIIKEQEAEIRQMEVWKSEWSK